MLIGLLTSLVLSHAASVSVGGLEACGSNHAWISIISDAGSGQTSLEVYPYPCPQAPLLRVAPEGKIVSGGALKTDGQGNLMLFYTLSDRVHSEESTIFMRRCPVDRPTEWSDPVRLGSGCVHSAPVLLEDGTLTLAVFRRGEGALTYSSPDGGTTWTEGQVVQIPGRRAANALNPALFTSEEGELRMACRSCDTGFSYVCTSQDGGRNWSTPVRFIQNPDRDFCALSLGTGKVFLLKCFKLDILQFYSNRELYGYFSDDGGISWYGDTLVSADDYVQDPVAALCPDGRMLIAWTQQYKGESLVKIAWMDKDKSPEAETAFSAGKSGEVYRRQIAHLTTPRTHWGKKGIRLGSYNIQRQGFGSGPSWQKRKAAVIEEFQEHKWDIVGTQEATPAYAEEIIDATGDVYAYFADTPVYMGDKARAGSENPVLYRKSRFTLLECGVIEYAIRQDYFAGARSNKESYGSEYHRSTIWGHFYDKSNQMEFYCVNLHGPVRSAPAQEAYARLMLDSLSVIAKGLPVVITGDFNYSEESWAYRYLTDCDWLSDSMTALPESKRKNWEYNSFCGYQAEENISKNASHLDHIFYTPASVRIDSWWLDIHTIHDNKYASDHLPLTVEFRYAN